MQHPPVTLEIIDSSSGQQRRHCPDIAYTTVHTRFGRVLLASTEHRRICQFSFLATDKHYTEALQTLRHSWPQATLTETPDQTDIQYQALFAAESEASSAQPVDLLVQGTPFQAAVWRALLKIPFGSVCSYQQLAETVGHPRAVRAVANAVGRNPIAYLIPCHRVIRSDGTPGGYRWGLACKKALQAWERSNTG